MTNVSQKPSFRPSSLCCVLYVSTLSFLSVTFKTPLNEIRGSAEKGQINDRVILSFSG